MCIPCIPVCVAQVIVSQYIRHIQIYIIKRYVKIQRITAISNSNHLISCSSNSDQQQNKNKLTGRDEKSAKLQYTESKMKKSILCILASTTLVSANNNIIIGDDNYVKGSRNVQVGFNTVIDGSDNWTVGNKHVVLGSGVKMFGPEADPIFYANSPAPAPSTHGTNNFNAFFDSFDPFTYQPDTSSVTSGQKRWYGTSSNWRW